MCGPAALGGLVFGHARQGAASCPRQTPALLFLTWNQVPILQLGVLPRGKPEQVRGDDREAFWGGHREGLDAAHSSAFLSFCK